MYRRFLAGFIIFLSITGAASTALIQSARAASLNIDVTANSVSLNYGITLVENMTLICCVPPQFRIALTGSNGSSLKESLTEALKRLVTMITAQLFSTLLSLKMTRQHSTCWTFLGSLRWRRGLTNTIPWANHLYGITSLLRATII